MLYYGNTLGLTTAISGVRPERPFLPILFWEPVKKQALCAALHGFPFKEGSMTMNRGNMFNRRMRQWQDSASHLQSAVRDQASSLADQTMEGLEKGQKAVGKWEKAVMDSARDNPTLFLGIAAAVIALAGLLAGLILSRKK